MCSQTTFKHAVVKLSDFKVKKKVVNFWLCLYRLQHINSLQSNDHFSFTNHSINAGELWKTTVSLSCPKTNIPFLHFVTNLPKLTPDLASLVSACPPHPRWISLVHCSPRCVWSWLIHYEEVLEDRKRGHHHQLACR